MSKSILEYSISLFLIAAAICMVLFTVTARRQVHEYVAILETQVQAQDRVLKAADEASQVVMEAGIAAGVRFLENEKIIPPSEANKMVDESIEVMSRYSPRIAEIAKHIDNRVLSDRIEK
jgi:predicted transcriptional regulator